MTCRAAAQDMRNYRGQIFRRFRTPGGFACSRVSGGQFGGPAGRPVALLARRERVPFRVPRLARARTIVGLGGSLAKLSRGRAALEVALAAAADAGAEPHLLDLRELDLSMYDPALELTP